MIPPVVFPNSPEAGTLPTKLMTTGEKPNFLPESALLSVSRSSVLFFTFGLGVASVTSLGANLGSAVAQVPPTPDQKLLGERTISQVNVIFVNPSAGDDIQGNGSQGTPLKTITQALRVATANTVIMLSTGTYSTETGEVFPVILRTGVSIQGDARTQGKGITIQGGGDYLSRSFGGQNVTIVGANQATLTGVTVTNPNPRGYGLWIESTNPVVTENTFTASTQDGISVTGNAAPTIRKNYFYRNGANGITVAGNSQAQLRENMFQQTGFGINIAQNAAPVIVGNQIQSNRAGVVVQANARPILRSNLIQGSKEDGLVAIAQAMPDLGTATEPGGNQFQNNARYDINASAAKQVITASGNNIAKNRVVGKVEIESPTALIARNPLPLPPSLSQRPLPDVSANGEIVFAAPGISETPKTPITQLPNNSNPRNRTTPAKLNNQLMPLQPANAPLAVARSPQLPTSKVAGFPVPSSLARKSTPITTPVSSRVRTASVPAQPPKLPQLNYVQIDPKSVEFTAANSTAQPPLPSSINQQQPLPRREANSVVNSPEFTRGINPPANVSILPVPSSNIPLGNTRNMQKVPVPETYPTGSYGGSLPYAAAPQTSLRYRVLVEVANERDQELVRYLVPGAFSTVSRGRNVMQVGVFSNQYNADGMMRTLNSNGLKAIIELL